MKLEDLSPNVVTLRITGAQRLDPITLYLTEEEEGQGNVTIECYDKAWTTWFSAMGAMTLQQFLVGVDADYLHSRLLQGGETKAQSAYLMRIVVAVQAALSEAECARYRDTKKTT